MLIDEIKQFFKGEVMNDEATIEKYSRDYSIFKVKPTIVVFPKDVEDIKNLVKFINKKKEDGENISLSARSGGTDMTGGSLTESIVIEFDKYFNHIKEIGSNYAVVEPGVYYRDFEKALTEKGLLYPPFPASKDICALGGMIANNSAGEKTLIYGKTENFVEELKVVLSDGEEYLIKPLEGKELEAKLEENTFEGEIYRKLHKMLEGNYEQIKAAKPQVSKNSAGYFLWNVWDKKKFDLNQLIVGSQGTLAIVVEAKLRVVPIKKHSRLAVVFLSSLDPAANLIVEVLKFKPETLESYDDKTLWVALKFLPSLIKAMKGSFFSLVWKFIPEAFMALQGGIPKMVVLIEITSDDEKELDEKMKALHNAVKKMKLPVRIMRDKSEEEKYWAIRHYSFKLLHDHSTGKDTAPFIDDIIVNPSYLPEFLPKLNKILDKYKKDLIYTIAGHPGNGNFHIIPLMDLRKAEVRALIPVISKEVYDLVVEYKGSFTAEHNDGLVRTPFLEQMFGKAMIEKFQETKDIFDPKNIFNPGKKVGGSLDYSMSHVKSTMGE